MSCHNDPANCPGCLYCDAACDSAAQGEPAAYPLTPNEAIRFPSPAQAMTLDDQRRRAS